MDIDQQKQIKYTINNSQQTSWGKQQKDIISFRIEGKSE